MSNESSESSRRIRFAQQHGPDTWKTKLAEEEYGTREYVKKLDTITDYEWLVMRYPDRFPDEVEQAVAKRKRIEESKHIGCITIDSLANLEIDDWKGWFIDRLYWGKSRGIGGRLDSPPNGVPGFSLFSIIWDELYERQQKKTLAKSEHGFFAAVREVMRRPLLKHLEYSPATAKCEPNVVHENIQQFNHLLETTTTPGCRLLLSGNTKGGFAIPKEYKESVCQEIKEGMRPLVFQRTFGKLTAEATFKPEEWDCNEFDRHLLDAATRYAMHYITQSRTYSRTIPAPFNIETHWSPEYAHEAAVQFYAVCCHYGISPEFSTVTEPVSHIASIKLEKRSSLLIEADAIHTQKEASSYKTMIEKVYIEYRRITNDPNWGWPLIGTLRAFARQHPNQAKAYIKSNYEALEKALPWKQKQNSIILEGLTQ